MASNRSAHTQNFYSPSSPPLWQVGGRRRSSSHDQKLVMASSRRALGGRIFADVLGRCGAEASLMEVRRCDSNSSQIASLTALDPSLVRRRWLILSSLAVQLTLTRLPPRSVPPPPIPRAPSAARTARFPPPPPNPAPAEPAEPPLSIWPSLCARGGSSLHGTLPSNPGAPPPPLTRDSNSFGMFCCRCFELSPAAAIALAADASPPSPLHPGAGRRALTKIEFSKAPSHVSRRPAARLTAVRTPPARA